MATHALKGAAETCCATALTLAAFELEDFAAAFTGYNGSKPAGEAEAADVMSSDFEPAEATLFPRVEQRAAIVMENIRLLGGMLAEERIAQLAEVEGFVELILVSSNEARLQHLDFYFLPLFFLSRLF